MANTASHASPHVTPIRIYISVGLALLVLTAVTVIVSRINLGGWNVAAALGIASIKALLVAFVFMHLLYDNKFYAFIFANALLMLAILIVLTMFDTLSRGDIYNFRAEPITREAKIYQRPAAVAADSAAVEDTAGHGESESEQR